MQLIRGDKLDHRTKQDVLSAFCNRYLYGPPNQDDEYWLATHKFYIRKNGTLAYRPDRCEPVLGDELEAVKARFVIGRLVGAVPVESHEQEVFA